MPTVEGALNFFLIDDDTELLTVLAELLRGAGHRVTTFSSGLEALAQVREAAPDCLIVDLMMPDMDGFDLCHRLCGDPSMPRLKVIVLSMKAYEFDRQRVFALGADGFLTKPIRADLFVEQVTAILAEHVDLTYWGVRGTLPVPGPSSLIYGGNTSCVTMRLPDGNYFIFDAGSGIKNLGSHLMQAKHRGFKARIFISHPHWDHINALPFFAPLYVAGNEFEILGASHGDVSMRELISAQMDGVYFPIQIKAFSARVYFHNLKEETLSFGDTTVRTMLLNHPGNCLGYRVSYHGRSIVYLTDHELLPRDHAHYNARYMERLAEFVRGCDVLISDTTYTEEEYAKRHLWGHSSVTEVARLAHRAGVGALHLFHHDPDQDDTAIAAKLEEARSVLSAMDSDCLCEAPKEGQHFEV
ncbi:MAG: response regulator [Magnetococcales bacterium]|nr:response regulator [Magnetococcales bacterium]